ncbi:hypothetical protein MNEG_4001 [Monoraphidium neglectum]|uniref:Uncharacterized protein n=1 Tax=Monoraphidium neglectum TaxID=145388 RepID=A0A0D2JZL7_9CHLO|nr:hypothetical protein MNEG_4001 [Monoraphidium neglectum]KIZ03953.1 hypothetical protein MNEG_4001 [Monoraphidium neglectum]|eukprot:XP_013902972.1 hypothetical protein MNEG_4001 [Monoraphidium neglectum]
MWPPCHQQQQQQHGAQVTQQTAQLVPQQLRQPQQQQQQDCSFESQPASPRVSRSPLKRRSTGLPCRGGASLSRNYVGKSQSFDSIQDLTRNPWGGESALTLAKRRALPLPVPGTEACCEPGCSGSGRMALSTCEPGPLSWSIDEEDECLLGGITCRARLSAGSGSDSSGAGASSGGALAVACRRDDASAGSETVVDAATAVLTAAAAAAAPPWAVPRAHVPVVLERRSWDAAPCRGGSIDHAGMRIGMAGAARLSVSRGSSGGSQLAPACMQLPPLMQANTRGGGGAAAYRARPGSSCSGSDSGASSRGGGPADDLVEALRGARLSPCIGGGVWLAAPLMESG